MSENCVRVMCLLVESALYWRQNAAPTKYRDLLANLGDSRTVSGASDCLLLVACYWDSASL